MKGNLEMALERSLLTEWLDDKSVPGLPPEPMNVCLSVHVVCTSFHFLF